MAKAEDLGVDDVVAVVRDVFGLEGDVSKGEMRMLCPVHELGGVGHKPSCDVNVVTGYWNCWSCQGSGDLIDLGVVALSDLSFSDRKKKIWLKERGKIRRLIEPNDPNAITAAIRRRVRTAQRVTEATRNVPDRWEPMIPPEEAYEARFPKYLKQRGFNKESVRRWGIRYAEEATLLKEDGNSFTLTDAIAIPIYSREKILEGWCYRATPRSESWFRNVRYIYTPGITDTLSQLWFGMHLHKDLSEVAVVEGALDAIWCDQQGVPALAILGSQVKQVAKVRQLMDFRKVVLFTDRDQSGAMTAHTLGNSLQERGVPVSVVLWPRWMKNQHGDQAKDAQDLCGVDIELLYARAVPFFTWRKKNRMLSTTTI